LEKNKDVVSSTWMQLATVCAHTQRPSVRTVVFRGFTEHEGKTFLKFITDKRAAKVYDIQCDPNVEICAYFQETREQFRIAGSVRIFRHDEKHTNNPFFEEERLKTFNELSESTRAQFVWPKTDGDDASHANIRALPINQSNDELLRIAYENFAIGLLDTVTVDHLQLIPNLRKKIYGKC